MLIKKDDVQFCVNNEMQYSTTTYGNDKERVNVIESLVGGRNLPKNIHYKRGYNIQLELISGIRISFVGIISIVASVS